MPKTHDLPSGHFFHLIKVVKGTPLRHVAVTQEYEPPFRRSDSKITRLWPTRLALVTGKWYDSELDEDEALLAALDGRGDAADVVDEDGHILEQWERPDAA